MPASRRSSRSGPRSTADHRLPCLPQFPTTSMHTRRTAMPSNTVMPAITHVALTVSDVSASKAWYTRVLGAEPVLDEQTGAFRHVVYQLGGTLLGLHYFDQLVSSEPFNERRPGL